MNINKLFQDAARVGIQRITLALSQKDGKPVVAADQFIKDPQGFMSTTQHQVSAATHEAACLTMLHRAQMCARMVGPAIVQPEDGDLVNQ